MTFSLGYLTESELTNPVGEFSLLIVPRRPAYLALNLKLGADGFHPARAGLEKDFTFTANSLSWHAQAAAGALFP